MKQFILLMALTLSFTAFAGEKPSLECIFLDPVITIRITSTSASLGEIGNVVLWSDSFGIHNGKITDTSDSDGIFSITFETEEGGSEYILNVDTFKNGNDGLSKKVYDYKGVFIGDADEVAIGGCNRSR